MAVESISENTESLKIIRLPFEAFKNQLNLLDFSIILISMTINCQVTSL